MDGVSAKTLAAIDQGMAYSSENLDMLLDYAGGFSGSMDYASLTLHLMQADHGELASMLAVATMRLGGVK